MRVLFVSCFGDLMLKDSGALVRIYNLARNLASLENEVRMVVPATDDAVEQAQGFTVSKIRGISPMRLLKPLSELLGISSPLPILWHSIS